MKKYFFFILVLTLVLGCVNYQQLSFRPADLGKNKRFENNIERYNIILHKDSQVSILSKQKIQGNSVIGRATFTTRDSIVEKPVTKDAKLRHRQDVHIYMKPEATLELPSEQGAFRPVEVRFDDVNEIVAMTTNSNEIIGTVFIVIGAILLVVLFLALLFVVFIGVFIAAALGVSNGSSTASGNSDSGGSESAGSDSGGSDSGDSGSGDSGGSNSSSGCYIATMAYGDYEHPQVKELRRFRDRHLSKTKNGRRFIAFYYKYSPMVVAKTTNFKTLHRFIRTILNQFIKCLPK